MGVYIPNMEKPKDCKECQWHLDFYIEDEQVGGLCTITEKDDRENTCPLIEIATCGECKWWVKDGNDSFGYAMFCEHDCSLGGQGIKKPTDFCSYAERRADDKTEESRP